MHNVNHTDIAAGLKFPYPTMEQLRQQRVAASDPQLADQLQASIDQGRTDPKPADSKPARKPRAVAKKKPAAPAKPRTPPLPLGERFKIADAIRLADPTETDAALAARVSPFLLRPVNAQLVGKYRTELGLQPVKEVPASVLRARVAELERQLELAKQGRLELDNGTDAGLVEAVAAKAMADVLGGAQ